MNGRSVSDGPQSGSIASIQRAGTALKRRIAGFSALIVVVIATLVGTVIVEQRGSARDRAQGNAANLSAAFEEQVRRVMDNASGVMDLLIRQIQNNRDAFDLSEWTRQIPEFAASIVQAAIIGADGKLVSTTLDPHPAPVDLSDREHFRVHRDNPDMGLFVGKPVRGRVSNIVTIQITKRIAAADGGFGGVLVFSLDPEFLTGLHHKVDLGKSGSIALVGKDAVIRARFTSTKGLDSSIIGSALPNSPIVARAATETAGSTVMPSLIDGLTRIYHWRTITGYPLIVIVGLGEEEALAAGNRHATAVLALGTVALSLPLIMMLMLNREISLRVARAIALHEESEKLRAANDILTAQHNDLLTTSAALSLERMKLTHANAELVRATLQAEEASRAKSSFLANISHELRTPLNAIIGFAEIIRDRLFGEDLPRYCECAADIQVSGVHLLNIINSVLDLAKIEAGRFVLYESVVSLDTMVDETLTTIRPQAASGEITLLTSLPDGGTHLRCDETRFKQILINLLSNAVKFTPAGGTVTLTAEREADGSLVLAVSDTGIGMSEQEIASAFELFRQVDSAIARRFPGTGLGLPLVVQLSELHGAALELQSAPGAGTIVRVRLPAARVVGEGAAAGDGEDDADRRFGDRKVVRQVVLISSNEARFESRTVDLSETGVRIEHIAGLAQGDRIRLEMGPHVAEGIVVWQSPTHIGVKFLEGGDGEPSARLHDAA